MELNHFGSELFMFKPGFHKANFDHDNDPFRVKTKQLVEGMTAQPNNCFVSCVMVVEFAVNGNQALAGTSLTVITEMF